MANKYKAVLFGISIIILATVIWYANPSTLLGVLIKSDMRMVFLGIGISLVAMAFRVLKWRVLLEGVGFLQLFPVQVLGMTISNFTPGKIGEPAKAVILKLNSNIDVSRSLPSIIWERVMDVLVLIVLSLTAMNLLSVGTRFYFIGIASVAAFLGLIIFMLLILHNRRIGNRIFSVLRRVPFLKSVSGEFLDTFYDSRIKKGRIVVCLVFTLVPWLLEGVMLYLALAALGVFQEPFVLAGVVALAVLVGVASSLPGGLGSTEVVMSMLLGILGIPATTAIAGTMLYRFLSFWFGSFVGCMCLIYLSRRIELKGIL